MHRAVVREVRALAEDRLLEIADHAEVPGARRRRRFQPGACGLGRARDLEEHVELRGIGVLRLVEDHAVVFRADASRRFGMAQQCGGERDLVVVGHRAAAQPELAVIPRDLRRDVQSAAQRTHSRSGATAASHSVPAAASIRTAAAAGEAVARATACSQRRSASRQRVTGLAIALCRRERRGFRRSRIREMRRAAARSVQLPLRPSSISIRAGTSRSSAAALRVGRARRRRSCAAARIPSRARVVASSR